MTAPLSASRIFWRCTPGRRLPANAWARDLVPAQRYVGRGALLYVGNPHSMPSPLLRL